VPGDGRVAALEKEEPGPLVEVEDDHFAAVDPG
jgi:hypothetical protein